jgi:hypothetical protein
MSTIKGAAHYTPLTLHVKSSGTAAVSPYSITSSARPRSVSLGFGRALETITEI